MSLALGGGEPDAQTGKRIRILQCFTCRTMEVLPDFEGNPNDDVMLHDVDFKHGGHEDDATRIHERALHGVIESNWDNPRIRRKIVKDMWASTKGFTPEYYDFKDTLKEDAMKCWQQHRRPGLASSHLCSDYRAEHRRIGNPAKRDRQLLAKDLRDDNIAHSGPRVFLCQFCPYHSDVQRMKADKYGDFSDKLN